MNHSILVLEKKNKPLINVELIWVNSTLIKGLPKSQTRN